MGKKIMQSRNDEYHKLTCGERIGYGMGDFAQKPGFRHNRRLSCSTYVDGEYDQYGHCGVHFFLFVRIINVFWDPMVGTYVDKKDVSRG